MNHTTNPIFAGYFGNMKGMAVLIVEEDDDRANTANLMKAEMYLTRAVFDALKDLAEVESSPVTLEVQGVDSP